jgi:hypothetical protein
MIDITKPVQRRDGGAARIIFAAAKGDRPIIALHEFMGHENPHKHFLDGRLCTVPSDMDLVPKKVKKWRWAIQWENSNGLPINIISSERFTEQGIKSIYAEKYIIGRILESEIEE